MGRDPLKNLSTLEDPGGVLPGESKKDVSVVTSVPGADFCLFQVSR